MHHRLSRLPASKTLLVLLPVAFSTPDLFTATHPHLRTVARAFTTPLLSALQHPARPSAAPRAHYVPSDQPSLAITPRAGHLAQAAAAIGAPPGVPHHRLLATPGVRHFVLQNFIAPHRAIAPFAEPAPALQDEATYDPAADTRGGERLHPAECSDTHVTPPPPLPFADELPSADEPLRKVGERQAPLEAHHDPTPSAEPYDPAAGARGGERLHPAFAEELRRRVAPTAWDFYNACRTGDVARVESFLQTADESTFHEWQDDQSGLTSKAFLIACEEGHAKIVELLLESPLIKDETITARCAWGENALHLACSRGHGEVIRHLLDHRRFPREAINGLNRGGASAFHIACYEGHEEAAHLLLDCRKLTEVTLSAECNDYAYNGGILHHLSSGGTAPLLRRVMPLLRSTNCHSALDVCGETPFERACTIGDLATVQVILEEEGCPDEVINRIDRGRSAFTQAMIHRTSYLDRLGRFIPAGTDERSRVLASNREVIGLLLTHPRLQETTINASAENFIDSALFFACRAGDPQMFQMLLESPRFSRAPLNGRDAEGRTALHLSCASVAKVLLDHPEFSDDSVRASTFEEGETALHDACQKGNVEKVTLLMHYARRRDKADKAGDFVRSSQPFKSMVNARDRRGYTPLHALIALRHPEEYMWPSRDGRSQTEMCRLLLFGRTAEHAEFTLIDEESAPPMADEERDGHTTPIVEDEENDGERSSRRQRGDEGKQRRTRQSETCEGEEDELSDKDDRASATGEDYGAGSFTDDEEDDAGMNALAYADVNARVRRTAGAGQAP